MSQLRERFESRERDLSSLRATVANVLTQTTPRIGEHTSYIRVMFTFSVVIVRSEWDRIMKCFSDPIAGLASSLPAHVPTSSRPAMGSLTNENTPRSLLESTPRKPQAAQPVAPRVARGAPEAEAMPIRVLLDEVAAETRRNLQLIGASTRIGPPGQSALATSPPSASAQFASGPQYPTQASETFAPVGSAPGSSNVTPRNDDSLVLRLVSLLFHLTSSLLYMHC